MNRKELAEYLNVSPQTIANWKCQDRKLPEVILGPGVIRYRRAEIDAWLEREAAAK